jgi:hypothetical protein
MPILLILQALGKAALDAAKTRAGNVVVAAALAYGWGHHNASAASEARAAQERAALAAAHAKELAREQEAARVIAKDATERAQSDALEARALQARIDDLRAKDNLDVPPASNLAASPAPRPCLVDGGFARVLRDFDAGAGHRKTKAAHAAK